jgi:hypothetical protein
MIWSIILVRASHLYWLSKQIILQQEVVCAGDQDKLMDHLDDTQQQQIDNEHVVIANRHLESSHDDIEFDFET